MPVRFLLLFISIFLTLTKLSAQHELKVGDLIINRLDQQKRKQGEWVFFNPQGKVWASCYFENDSCVSPTVFYEKGDTTFIIGREIGKIKPFVLYFKGSKYKGYIKIASEDFYEIYFDHLKNENPDLVNEVKKYCGATPPLYYFAQKQLIEYQSIMLQSSNYIRNKPTNAILSLTASGLVIKVEFPKEKNNLSDDEERLSY